MPWNFILLRRFTAMTGGFSHKAFVAAVGACLTSVGAAAGEPAPFMMRAHVGSRLIEGQPLAWTQQQMLLLGR
ncbi:MAG TPA: hypothetical protein VF175_04075, partial [Lacipirellula sp.]